MIIMKKSKNSSILSVESLVIIIASALMFMLIILPACSKVYAYFKNKDYTNSFESLVNGINNMGFGRQEFLLRMGENMFFIGLNSKAEEYKCVGCYEIGQTAKAAMYLDLIFIKPQNEACNKKPCICLCSSEMKLKQEMYKGETSKILECPSSLLCRETQNEIIDGVEFYGKGWNGGFLFSNTQTSINGLKPQGDSIKLIVEKKPGLIGVCNNEIFDNNKKLNFDMCIITEFDIAKKEPSDSRKLELYQEFIKKYKTGANVEAALYEIGLIYLSQSKADEASKALCRLINDFPTSNLRALALSALSKLYGSEQVTEKCSAIPK